MFSTNSLLSALLLSSHVLPTLSFSAPSRFAVRGSRTAVRQQMRDDVVFYDPHYEEQQQQQSTCIAKDSKIHIGVFSSTKPLVIEGELNTRELECREDILIQGKVRGNIQGGLLITINGVLDGNVDCYEVVIGPGAIVTGDVRCRDVVILDGGCIGGQLFCETMKAAGDFPPELPPAHMAPREFPPLQQAHWQANMPRAMDIPPRAVAESRATHDNVYREAPPNGPTMSVTHQEEIINTKAFLDRAVSRRRTGEWKPMQPRVSQPNGEIPRKHSLTGLNGQEPVSRSAENQRWAEEQQRVEAQQRAEEQQRVEAQHRAEAQQLAEEQLRAEEEQQRAEVEANQLFDRHDRVPPISDVPVDDEPEWANLPHQRIEIPEWADKVASNRDLPCVDATIEGKNVIKQPYVPTSDYTVWTTETVEDNYATDPFAGAPFGAAAAAMHPQYDYGPSPHHYDDFGNHPCDEYGNPYFDDFGPQHHNDFGSPHHAYHNRPVDDSYYNNWSNHNQYARP